ncbi:MAG: methylmalonyl-CoA epimerase [Deltaproteobacteria bacterium RBG_16_54_11]|jgi:methylmalonyl-CoA/ethylmalonyl-CoA epimerase|nr:MAG: methylmalonyl-CoA epimerase [Deltaproteobacteria bacterium RBG_16_54_11]
MIKKIDHIAVVVPNLEEGAKFYKEFLGLNLADVEEIEGMDTKVGFIAIGETKIELVQPTKEETGLAKYLANRGPGIHHICLEVDDIEADLKAFKEKGALLIDETPRKGAHGMKVGFIHPKTSGGVLIELCEPSHPKD